MALWNEDRIAQELARAQTHFSLEGGMTLLYIPLHIAHHILVKVVREYEEEIVRLKEGGMNIVCAKMDELLATLREK